MAFRVVAQPGQPIPSRQTPQAQPTGLIPSLAKPFVKTGQNIFSALYEGGRFFNPIGRATGFDPYSIPNPFMSEETLSRFTPQNFNLQSGSPLEEQLRNSAAIGSWAVPFGRGTTLASKALIPGAASGALSGLSQEGATAGSVATSAGTGAVLSGLISKLLGGKVPAPAREAGEVPTITGSKLPSTPSWATNRERLVKEATGVGITDAMPSLEKARTLDKSFQQYQDEIGRIVKNAPPLPAEVIQENFAKNLAGANIDQTKPLVQSELKRAMAKVNEAIGDNVKLNELKTIARKEMGNTFSKGGVNNTPKQEVWGAIYDTVKDSLDSIDPVIREINGKQRTLFELAEEIVPQAQKSMEVATVPIPFTRGAQIPTPVTREGFTRFFGNAGKTVASPVKALTQGGQSVGLPQLPANLVGPASKVTTNAMTQQPASAPDTVPNFGGSLTDTLNASPTVRNIKDDQINTLLQLALIRGDIPPSAISALQSLGGIPQKESAAQVKSREQLASFENSINQLESAMGEVPTGIGGAVSSVTSRVPFVDLAPDTKTFRALRNVFTGPTARVIAAEVGVLTDQDIARASDILPAVSDGPEVRQRKMQAIRQAINNLKAGNPLSPEGKAEFGGSGASDVDSLMNLF